MRLKESLEMLNMLRRISKGLLLVNGANDGRFPYSHSAIIEGQKGKAVLLDTGCGIEVLKELRTKFSFDYIINSHTHPDHSAGNWLFKDDVRDICVPRESFGTAGNMMALSERLAEPGFLAEYWREFVAKALNFKDCRPTRSFDSQSSFDIGDVSLQPIYTPGHTIDHYCFYEPSAKVLFSVDYDLSPFGPWYGHRESSINDFKESVERLKKLDIAILVSGHRGIITNDIRSEFDKFCSKIDRRNEKILTLVGQGYRTIDQLVEKAPIYGRFSYAEPLLRYWEGNMIKKHLAQLILQGKIARLGEEFHLR
jgi:glyoxylase-like metal-dependent hydrolase (beta-lactamase superfamily II)